MLVICDGLQEFIARFPGGSFRAEKAAAHVVVETDDLKTIACEMANCLRADKTGGSSDDDFAHGKTKAEYVPGLRLCQEPGETAVYRRHLRRRISLIALQDFVQEPGIFVRVGQKANVPGLIDDRKGEGNAPGVDLRNEIRHDIPEFFVERRRSREQRSGVAVIPYPKKNQVVPVD